VLLLRLRLRLRLRAPRRLRASRRLRAPVGAFQGRDGYGYCFQACLGADVVRHKARLWSAGSGRRPAT
jgi:hypothetical protein